MKAHRYPPQGLAGDYARGALGAAVTGGPLLFLPTTPIIAGVLAGFAALFVLFAARTAIRHMTVVQVDDAGIAAVGPLGVAVPWDGLGRLVLSYYSTRRDRTQGWMQLSLRGTKGRALRVDSSIEGFSEIAAEAARRAEARRIDLSPATIGNLAALGIAVAQAQVGEEAAHRAGAGRA